MDSVESPTGDLLNRRQFLRRIAQIGGAAWATPVIVSIDALPASATPAPAPVPIPVTTTIPHADDQLKDQSYSLRVQLQEGLLNTYGVPRNRPTSISVAIVREAMLDLYKTVQVNAQWYPFTKGEAPLRDAIISISQRLDRYPPSGICGLLRGFETTSWSVSGREFRLDLDNLAGCNLTI